MRVLRTLGVMAALSLLALVGIGPAQAEAEYIILASTTSTQQSGLFDYLLPIFTKQTGIEVRVVAVGTGQALAIGARGDADALLVHDRAGEEKLVAAGDGIDRRDVMVNDFILVGPVADPAHVRGTKDVEEAMKRIAGLPAPFASRGDDSGTNRMELRLWKAAGIEPPKGGAGWYRELGSGMGETLNTAAAMDAYTLSDRATWAAFKNRRNLGVVLQGDPRLLNPYSSILVNPERHPGVRAAAAKRWHDWLTGREGQKAIASFTIGGEQLFFPSAKGEH